MGKWMSNPVNWPYLHASYSILILNPCWLRKQVWWGKIEHPAPHRVLTPWLVRVSISFSISGQCWGHSLFIISTTIRDRASLMWLSSSKIEWVPWKETIEGIRAVQLWTVKWSVFHKSHLHLITAAWRTLSGGLSPVAACRSIWICRETLAFCQTWIPYHAFSLLHLLQSPSTYLMICSRICKPKCLTTAGWALSANCKPHGTHKELVSLNSSQNWREEKRNRVILKIRKCYKTLKEYLCELTTTIHV